MKKTYNVVKIEETALWGEDFAPYGPIWGVYAYNPNVAYHMCELTPSFELLPLYSYAEGEMPDDVKELFYEAEMFWTAVAEPCYIWCHQVPATVPNGVYEFEVDEDDDTDDVAIEYFQGNCPV